MKAFIIFDSAFSLDSLVRVCTRENIDQLTLFSLSSDATFNERCRQVLSAQGCQLTCVNSAEIIHDWIDQYRSQLIEWSAQLGEQKIGAKTVKETLLLSDNQFSTWWTSLLSEKNTVASDAFFQMAQVAAVKQYLSQEKYNCFILSCARADLKSSLRRVGNGCQRVVILKTLTQFSFKQRLKNGIKKTGLLGALISGLYSLWDEIKQARGAKTVKGREVCRAFPSASVLFVSCFPAIEQAPAEQNVFRNKYATALQDLMAEMQIPITWLLLSVNYEGYTFQDSLSWARRFLKQGEKLFILQEFLTFSSVVKTFFIWLRQVVISEVLWHRLKKKKLYSGPIGVEHYPILKSLWRLSFVGAIGLRSILYAEIFKNIFKELKHVKDCIYYCEMRSFEKILNAIKNKISPAVRTIGFQHSAFSKNYYHYFYTPAETKRQQNPTDMPLPDALAADGEAMRDLLLIPKYPQLTQLEAARQLYLAKVLSAPIPTKPEKPMLLIVGSGGNTGGYETESLVQLVHAAFPRADQVEIWFKSHPTVDFRDVFNKFGINFEQHGYQLCGDNVSEYLPKAWGVLVGSSTVAIEALAYGCEVLVPVFSDAMLMSPLMDFPDYYYKITTISALQAAWQKIANGQLLISPDQKRAFVQKYWDLDPALPKWRKLLEGRY